MDLVELGALEKGERPAAGKAVNSFVIDLVVGFALDALGRFPSDSQHWETWDHQPSVK